MINPSSRRRAFSRVEAVALGGVALLSGALLWPAVAQGTLFDSFLNARENARNAACQSNLKQAALGLLQYQQDYDEKSPPVSTPTHPHNGTWTDYDFGWANLIQPYIKSTQIYQCPSEKHPGKSNPDPTKPGYTDYYMNSRASGLTLSAFVSPSQTIIFGDGDGGSSQSTARYNIPALPGSWRTAPNSPARRHLQMANYAYADGHVKRLKPSDVTMAPLAQMAKYKASATFSPR